MAYSKSRSRKDFESQVALFKKYLRASQRRDIGHHIRSALLYSCIFQLCASLEEYCKSLIDSWIFEVRRSGLKIASMPERLRTYLLVSKQHGTYKSFCSSGDEKKLLDKLLIGNNNEFKLCNVNSPMIGFNSNIIYKGKSYPSPKNLRSVFNRLGIDDIFDEINRKTGRNYVDILRSFMDIREAIAHHAPPNLTPVDVDRYLEDLNIMTRTIDRVVYSHFSKSAGSSSWPSG